MANDEEVPTGCVIVFFIAVVAVIAFFVYRGIKTSAYLKPFKALSEQNLALTNLKEDTGAAYINRKLITVDKDTKEIDRLFLKLDKELRPESPEDVGTVIWLDWGRSTYGSYTDGAKAYRKTCQITVIDLDKGLIVDRRSFSGSKPPGSKSGGGSRSGSKPTREVIKYIESYPRK